MHPKTRTDMDRRIDALAASPIRTARPEFPPLMSAAIKSSPVSPDAQKQTPLVPSVDECRPDAGAVFTQHNPDITAYILSLPPNNVDHHGYQDAALSPGAQGDLANQTDQPMADADPLQPPRTRLHRLNTFLRRGTVMSTSTDMTSASLRKALSGKSSGFITQVKRVLRSTMPVHPPHGTSPIAEVYPETDGSMRNSWVHDEHAPEEITCAPPLPGEFLIVDRLLELQPCLGGLEYVHKTKNCLCRPTEAAGASIWMSETGLSERGARLVQPGTATLADFNEVDVFGNSLMHLLAARDVDHDYILQLTTQDVPCRARNSAGQTFLHLLDDSWLSDRDGARLVALLQGFRENPGFLLARDCYGRTLFHALRAKIGDPAPLARVLRDIDVRLSRDAFGDVPTCEVEMPVKPLRRAVTSVTSGDATDETLPSPFPRSPPLPRHESDLTATQARLLAFVLNCPANPSQEDTDGRNGLHCLAAAILSDTSVVLKTQGAGTPQPSKKRKREEGCKNALDSSRDRLELREGLLQGLLDAGVDANAYDGNGNTPLMAFCAQLPDDDDYKVPVSILQLLINRGADLHARNRRGETALHVAVRRGRKLAVRTLVNAGANVHVRDASGRGVLDVCDEGMAMGGEGDGDGEGGYMPLEACRAWLSSGQGKAVQDPGVLEEWEAGA